MKVSQQIGPGHAFPQDDRKLRVREEWIVVPGEIYAMELCEDAGTEYVYWLGDGKEVVFEDVPAWLLPVRPEGVLWVCSLRVVGDERG